MFLARKVSRVKWEPKDGIGAREIPADAVTADLRTEDNTLSFWRCGEASKDTVERAALAIAAAAERIDRLDIVWVAEERLQNEDQLSLKQADGRTPVQGMVRNHIDVEWLDYARLGKIASRVAQALRDRQHRRLTKKGVREILVAAIRERALSLDDLDDKVRAEIVTALDGES